MDLTWKIPLLAVVIVLTEAAGIHEKSLEVEKKAFLDLDVDAYVRPTGPNCVHQSPIDSLKRAPKARKLKPLPRPHGCGRSKYDKGKHRIGRIVNGRVTEEDRFPWVVGIGFRGCPECVECGGAIIDKRWVLTAAHCFAATTPSGEQLPLKKWNMNPCDISIHSGTNKILNKRGNLQIIPVESIIVHKGFNQEKFYHDIALLKLQQDIDLSSDDSTPLCLPWSKQRYRAKECVVAGWGTTKFGGDTSNVMLHVNLPHMSRKRCRRYLGKLHKGQICAGHPAGGRDSCQGDSGGPLMCPTGRKGKTHWRHIGIVSYGDGCAKKGSPGVYTDVRQYLGWIRNIITRYSGRTTIIPKPAIDNDFGDEDFNFENYFY